MIELEDELSVGDDGPRAWDVMLVVDEGGGKDKGNSLACFNNFSIKLPHSSEPHLLKLLPRAPIST